MFNKNKSPFVLINAILFDSVKNCNDINLFSFESETLFMFKSKYLISYIELN